MSKIRFKSPHLRSNGCLITELTVLINSDVDGFSMHAYWSQRVNVYLEYYSIKTSFGSI